MQPQESDKSSEPPMNDVLDFLVKFSDQVTQAGLWPAEEQQGVTSTATSSRPSSTNEEIPGVQAKARPPMPPVASSSSHTSGVHLATPSHGPAKALPLPVEEKYQKQQLVVNPYEMKKFLYGTSQKTHNEDCIDQNILKSLYINIDSIYRHENIKNEFVAFSKGSCFVFKMVANSLFTFVLILFLARKWLGKLLPKGVDGFVKLEDL